MAPSIESLAELRSAYRDIQKPKLVSKFQLPIPHKLPPNERRRASQVVRLTQSCIEQALQNSDIPVESLRTIFATDEGTGEICQQIFESLATTRQVSPLIFTNSVQNTPSGYFSIAWRSQQPSNVVSLGLESFAAGLLCAVTESLTHKRPVMLVAYDPAMTSPMDELLPIRAATSTAWIISDIKIPGNASKLGTFSLEMEKKGIKSLSTLPTWFPASWAENSSALGLAALGLLESPSGTSYRMGLGAQLLTLRLSDRNSS